MKEVADSAAPYWKNLTKKEKEPYEEKAKEDKLRVKLYGERYTSLGIPLSEVKREQEEREAKKRKEKETIDKMLDEACEQNSEWLHLLLPVQVANRSLT